LKKQLAGGGSEAELARWEHLLANNYVNTAVTGAFLVLVLLVVLVSMREWWRLLSGRRVPTMREEPYVTVSVAEAKG
jgi:carbon starvation protein